MTLACNICSLMSWPRLLWERRRAKPLLPGSFLPKAGGEARNGNWPWSPPPLATVTAEPASKDVAGYIHFMRWTGGQGIPCLCLDSANANWPLPNPQCNGKLQSYVSSLLPTTLVYLCLLENLFWGTNVISGMFCSHFAGMRWSGHFQVQTQRGGGLSWSSHIQVCTYLVIQVGPCFTMGCYPSEDGSAAARMLQQKYFWFSHSEMTDTMKLSLLKKCSSKEQQLVF